MGTARHRTAMRRDRLSRPLRLALTHELLRGRSVFDYGCGRGDDITTLRRLGIDANGWDPLYSPSTAFEAADVVHLGYVVNVIEDPVERATTLHSAWALARHCLIIAARLVDERDTAHIVAHRDGFTTQHGTFQRFYEQEELCDWLEATLGVPPAAAGPGVFYIFRSEQARQQFLASRFSRPTRTFARAATARQLEGTHPTLEPLIDFFHTRGRPPGPDELDHDYVAMLSNAFGSLRQASKAALLVIDPEDLNRAQESCAADVLVYLALSAFRGRPRLGDIPDNTRRDIKTLFASYRAACDRADRLLFAIGRPGAVPLASRVATVGKRTPAALYTHVSALAHLPAALRVYEGCARIVIGTIEEANLVKLATYQAAVSYLTYLDFDSNPHPILAESVRIDLHDLRVQRRSYDERTNRPILHRKELFVAAEYPRRATFERLTRQEERAGLFAEPAHIGTEVGWDACLAAAGVQLRGHRLIRQKPHSG